MVCRSIIESVVSLDMHKLVSYGLSKIFIKSSSIVSNLLILFYSTSHSKYTVQAFTAMYDVDDTFVLLPFPSFNLPERLGKSQDGACICF